MPPIEPADIEHRYSVDGDPEDPQPDKDDSIGGAISSTEIPDDTLNNDMSDITSLEAAAGVIKYRGWFYINKHSTHTYIDPKMWIESQTASDDTEIAIAIAAEAKNLAIERLADDETAPATVVFSQPATFGAGLAVGDLEPDDYRGHWAEYTVNADAAAIVDTYTLAVRGRHQSIDDDACMTLRQQLQEQFYRDLEKAPESFVNKKGIELVLDRNESIYIGYDKAPRRFAIRLTRRVPLIFDFLLRPVFQKRREWIASIQLTRAPVFFVNCTHCRSPNLIGMWLHGKDAPCRKCSKRFAVNITTPVPKLQEMLRRMELE